MVLFQRGIVEKKELSSSPIIYRGKNLLLTFVTRTRLLSDFHALYTLFLLLLII